MPAPGYETPHALFVRQTGTGVPLLLLNGLGAHHAMWEPLLEQLTGASIIFDWPGMGRSPARRRPYRMQQFARLAEDLVTSLGHTSIDLLGYSFGGIVAQHLTIARPDLIRRLVLVGTAPGLGSALGRPLAMASLSTPLRYYSRRYLAATSRFTSGGERERDPRYLEHSAQLRLMFKPEPLAYYGQLLAMNTSTTLHQLHQIKQPTLVVHGTDDPIIPAANGFLLAHRIPQARLLLAEGEGHMVLHHDPSQVAQGINDFLVSPDLRTSNAWAGAARVTQPSTRRALLNADLTAAQPIGALNALFRGLVANFRCDS